MYRTELRRAHCVATPGSAHSIIGSAIATKSSPPAAAFAWTEEPVKARIGEATALGSPASCTLISDGSMWRLEEAAPLQPSATVRHEVVIHVSGSVAHIAGPNSQKVAEREGFEPR